MVRVVSQSFNHPRSRHSSGETDLDLAIRADSALALSKIKRTDLNLVDCESSSDSFWDSELDTDQQELCCINQEAESDINGNRTSDKSDVTAKRKERRRERNKVSAQAYRQRKRQDNNSTHQELTFLEERNKQLLRQVHDLEEKTEQAKQFLKGQRGTFPDFLFPTKAETFSVPSSPSVTFESRSSPDNSNHGLSSPSPLSINLNGNSQHFTYDKLPHNSHQTMPNTNLNAVNLDVAPTTVNLNIPQVHSVNLNTPHADTFNVNTLGAEGYSSTMSETLQLPQSCAAIPAVKPKQYLFNANHYYKVPIHHSKVLHTVPEFPSNFSHEKDDNQFLPINKNQPEFVNVNDRSKDCYSEVSNVNVNLNINERLGRTLMSNENRITYNHHSPMNANAVKIVNMNDNDNLHNSNANKPHFQNSPHLINIHPNSFVQLIIATGENPQPAK